MCTTPSNDLTDKEILDHLDEYAKMIKMRTDFAFGTFHCTIAPGMSMRATLQEAILAHAAGRVARKLRTGR